MLGGDGRESPCIFATHVRNGSDDRFPDSQWSYYSQNRDVCRFDDV